MEHRQQHGNADAPGDVVGRAEEQRHGGVDHALLRKVQMLPQIGGVRVIAAAGAAQLLVMQPDHRRAEHRQRQQTDNSQYSILLLLAFRHSTMPHISCSR